jgi:hypothetical protein
MNAIVNEPIRKKITTKDQLNELLRFEVIHIDAYNRQIKVEVLGNKADEMHSYLGCSIDKASCLRMINSEDYYDSLMSSKKLAACGANVIDDPGFVIRYESEEGEKHKRVVIGNGLITRETHKGSIYRVDTPYNPDAFVISDKHVPGKFAIQWI